MSIEAEFEIGFNKGIFLGKRDVIMIILRTRFGQVPESITKKIATLSMNFDMDELIQRALTISMPEDLFVEE